VLDCAGSLLQRKKETFPWAAENGCECRYLCADYKKAALQSGNMVALQWCHKVVEKHWHTLEKLLGVGGSTETSEPKDVVMDSFICGSFIASLNNSSAAF